MFPNLDVRLQTELSNCTTESGCDIRVIASANCKNSTWIGGSIIASIATFQSMWVTPTSS